ncbi:permease-like cell division protein FtsX [Pseudobdellovibrio sp. HCB154]|uniref:permease-like cell division protein FtsX n=1 Tax=Pseudobdellovibrio sp. HCB154 TaxID=3386277 RepID=UPI0039174282
MKSVFHIIIGLFFSLLVSVLVTQNNINLFMGDADDFKKATIYFKQTTLESEADKFAQVKLQKVEKVKMISKEDAIKDFKNTFGDFSKNLSDLDTLTDLVPISYEVVFANLEDRKQFIASEASNELVDEIVAVDQIFSRYTSLQKSLGAFTFTLFAISFLVCALLTSLLIKNMINNDQRQIEIYALFGQSYSAIVKKYFKNLLSFFVTTAALSLVVVFVFFTIFKVKLHATPDLKFMAERLTFLSVSQFLILVLSFAVAYFGGLYVVLKRSVLKSFQR